jgi:signal transduction histidine kinase
MKRNKANARAYYDTILMSSPYDMTSFRDKRQYLKILSQSAVELDDYKQSYELENYLVDMVEKRNSIEEELYIMKYKERYQNEIGSRTRKYEIASLKAQKSRLAKLYVVGGGALLLLMSIPVVSINSIKQKKFQMAVSARSKQLSEINQQLESKREELERFAFITAHDLKSPILSILGFSHLLDKEVSVLSNPRLKEYIEFIISSGQQMKNLIQGVLEFAKLNRSNINEEQENIDLSSMVVEIKENLISESNISSSAKISIEGDCLELFTNRVIIYTLFGELIKNGLYYNQSDEPKVTIASNLNDDQIEVVFSDNGIGIDKQYHSKIFEMFSRLHNNHDYSGSGIGLAVVKKLVEDFDGDVSVESMKGVGSRFTVLLPKAFWNQGSKI